MITTEETFNAAVRVIRSLPKDGPYKPSSDMMLKFYSFYKQATEGACSETKPAFWEVIKKAKWDAWKKLGDMPQEEAMLGYIESLKKVVETMSYNEVVADFVDVLGPFYEMVNLPPPLHNNNVKMNDIVIEKLPNGDSGVFDMNGDSETEELAKSSIPEPLQNGYACKVTEVPEVVTDKFYSDSETDEEFSDPLEEHLEREGATTSYSSTKFTLIKSPILLDEHKPLTDENLLEPVAQTNGHSYSSFFTTLKSSLGLDSSSTPVPSDDEVTQGVQVESEDVYNQIDGVVVERGGGDNQGRPTGRRKSDQPQGEPRATREVLGQGPSLPHGSLGTGAYLQQSGGEGGEWPSGRHPSSGGDINEQIAVALIRLQRDMESVLSRLNTLEAITLAQHTSAQTAQLRLQESQMQRREPSWWPFPDMSVRTFLFFLAWPVAVQLLIRLMANRKLRFDFRRQRK